jgi:hypothetical protein
MTRLLHALPILALLALFSSAAMSPAAAEQAAGAVDRLTGEATATRGGFTRPLFADAQVFEGDRIETGREARLRLAMADGGVITLGADAVMIVRGYRTGPRPRATLELIGGAFLATTGAIAGPDPDAFTIQTPSAILGVRGTTVWGEQKDDHLAVLLLAGTAVEVISPGGTAILTERNDGTDVRGEAPPTAPVTWGMGRIAASIAKISFD